MGTMMRVKDGWTSVDFYMKHFGMKLIRVLEMPQYGFTNFFLASMTDEEYHAAIKALPSEEKPFDPKIANSMTRMIWNQTLELTWNHRTEHDPNFKVHDGNSKPQGFGHIGFLVDNLIDACMQMEANGVEFKKRPHEGKMQGIAFAYDPNGYWIELIGRNATFAGVCNNYTDGLV